MRLFVKVTPIKSGASKALDEGEILRCPADVEPGTLLSFLSQRFGPVVDTAWPSTERHGRRARGWILAGTDGWSGQQVLCEPFAEAEDGTTRSMAELLVDRSTEVDESVRCTELADNPVIAVRYHTHRPELDDEAGASQADTGRPATRSSGRTVSTGGGHRHGAGRAGATEFPGTWPEDQVVANIISVAGDPDRTPVWQPNQRWRVRGTRDGVEIIVIVKRDGAIWSAWPLPGGRGVQQNPTWNMNPEEAQLARTMQHLPSRFSDRLDADDTDALRAMAEAGEWAEEAELLVAILAANQQPMTHHEREDLRELLDQMELPSHQLDNLRTTDT